MKPWSVALALLVLPGCGPRVIAGGHTGQGDVDDSGSPADSAETAETADTHDSGRSGWPALVVNELMAQNTTTLADDQGNYPDWVELYNPTDEVVDLEGWTVSDSLEDAARFVLPALILQPGGFQLLYADGDSSLGEGHLDFGLDADGEAFGLYAPDGRAIDGLRFGAQTADISLARSPDGSETWVLASPATPGASNGG